MRADIYRGEGGWYVAVTADRDLQTDPLPSTIRPQLNTLKMFLLGVDLQPGEARAGFDSAVLIEDIDAQRHSEFQMRVKVKRKTQSK